MGNEVGSAAVSIVPSFKGFRKAVTSETDGAGKSAASAFTGFFKKAGSDSGSAFGSGFTSSAGLKSLTSDVAKASREVSASRLKEQDAAGKVRVAEAQLADARKKYAGDAAQVVAAEERVATAQRNQNSATQNLIGSTDKLSGAHKSLASATEQAASQSVRSNRTFAELPSFFGRSGTDSANSFGNSFSTGFRSNVGQIFTGAALANVVTQGAFALGRGIGDVISAGVGYSFKSIKLASDLGEALNANKVSFGDDIAKQLEVLGSTAPKRLALTRAAFAGFSTQFGAFAKIIRGNDVPGFLDELTTRGSDFASVYNLEVSDALQLFQSGLAGETEPLRKYGLDLSAASVSTYAYASGIAEAGTELTEAQKIQARYAYLLEQTSLVQGDFANTSGELAGQQKLLGVALEESQTQLGQYMIPAFTDLVSYANSDLLPVVGDIVDKVGPILGQAMTDSAPKVKELVDKLVPLFETFVSDGANALPGFLENVDTLIGQGGQIREAFKWMNDPDAQPAKFLNDVSKASSDAAAGIYAFLHGEDPSADAEKFWGAVTGATMWEEDQAARDKFFAAGAEYGDQYGLGLQSKLPVAQQSGSALGSVAVGGTREGAFGSLASGAQTGDDFQFGLQSKLPDASSAGVGLGAAAVAGADTASGGRTSRGGSFDSGAAAGDGFRVGIESKGDDAEAAGASLGRRASSGLNRELKINSPSKVTQAAGGFTADGFILGMTARAGDVERAAASTFGIGVRQDFAGNFGAESGGLGSSDRPIYADGSLLGWIREMANGEARLVVAGYDSARSETASRGWRG